ncbi:Nn.00g105640.m01.CDS01 [Neocucurbitaria sp. VM-36]
MRSTMAIRIFWVAIVIMATGSVAIDKKRHAPAKDVADSPSCQASSVAPPPPALNTSSSQPGPSPPPPPPPPPPPRPAYTFTIEISNQRQHVGAWYGPFVRDELSDVLYKKCPSKNPGASACATSVYTFDNIESSRPSDGVVEKEHGVEVHVASAFIPSDQSKELREALRDAFIMQIADTYMLSGLDDKNCYTYDRTGTLCIRCNTKFCLPPSMGRGVPSDTRGRQIRWCNAPGYVRVIVADGEGKEVAHMRVEVKFQGVTDQGRFDCVGMVETVERNAREERVGGGMEVGVRVVCEGMEVTGNCPNRECLYQVRDCFKKGG